MSEELEVKIEAIDEEIKAETEKRVEVEKEIKELQKGKEAHELAEIYKRKQQELEDMREINRVKALEAERMQEELFEYDTNDFFQTLKKNMYVCRQESSTESKSIFSVSSQPTFQPGEFSTSWKDERLVMRPLNHVRYMVDVPGIAIISRRKTNPNPKTSRRGGPAKAHDPTRGVAPPQVSKLVRNGKYVRSEFQPKLKVSGRVKKDTGGILSKRVTGAGGNR